MARPRADDVAHRHAVPLAAAIFETHVVPKTIKVKDDRVNLVFEIKENEKLAVRQVVFAGNAAFPRNKLVGVVKTGVTNPLSFVLDNDTYDPDKIENDGELLRQFYRAHGYDDVHVVASSSYDVDKVGVVVIFKIDEGPLYRFGKVDIDSTLKTVDAAALMQHLRTRSGEVYDADAVDKSVGDLAMQIAKGGEPFASVSAHTERVASRHLINLIYTIDQGRRVYVERIEVHGNTKTRDDVIRREFEFGEGDAYNRALVDRAQRRLKALGYFKTVTIQPSPARRPIASCSMSRSRSRAPAISPSPAVIPRPTAGWCRSASATRISSAPAISPRSRRCTATMPAVSMSPSPTRMRSARGSRSAASCSASDTFANTNQSYDTSLYGAKLLLGTPMNDQLGVTWNYSIYNQGVSLPAGNTASLPIQQAAQAGPSWVSSIGNSVTYSTLDNAQAPDRRHPRPDQQRYRRARRRDEIRPHHRRRALLPPDRRRRGRHGAGAGRLRDAMGRPAIAAARQLLRRPATGARLCAQRLRPARHHARHLHG